MVTRRIAFLILLGSAAVGSPTTATCVQSTFQPISQFIPPGTTHKAYALTDPAGQQTAVFDLEWGGALASLKQSGTERIWGHATGGMVQPAWHTFPDGVNDFNPTPGGDQSNVGSPVLAVRCVDANTLFVLSGALDYNRGNSPYRIGNTVNDGIVVPNAYGTMYVVATSATFVANPAGTPAYYLRLQQTITNAHPSDSFIFGFELAGYVPYSYTNWVRFPSNCVNVASSCKAQDTPVLAAGMYPSAALTNGTAFFISPTEFWDFNTDVFASFGTDNTNLNQSTHLFNDDWLLGPGKARAFTWYVMVGSWQNALAFAQSTGSATAFFSMAPCRVYDSRQKDGPIPSGTTRTVRLAGSCKLPVTARSAAINITAPDVPGVGSLTVSTQFGGPRGTLHFKAGESKANNAVLLLTGDGSLRIRADLVAGGSVDAILDVVGYFE